MVAALNWAIDICVNVFTHTTHAELLHAYEVAAKKRDLRVLSPMVVRCAWAYRFDRFTITVHERDRFPSFNKSRLNTLYSSFTVDSNCAVFLVKVPPEIPFCFKEVVDRVNAAKRVGELVIHIVRLNGNDA